MSTFPAMLLLGTLILLSSCTMHRGTVRVINLSDSHLERIQITAPDFERSLSGLPANDEFALHENISFREQWQTTVRLRDGSSFSDTLSIEGFASRRIEIRVYKDSVEIVAIPDLPR